MAKKRPAEDPSRLARLLRAAWFAYRTRLRSLDYAAEYVGHEVSNEFWLRQATELLRQAPPDHEPLKRVRIPFDHPTAKDERKRRRLAERALDDFVEFCHRRAREHIAELQASGLHDESDRVSEWMEFVTAAERLKQQSANAHRW